MCRTHGFNAANVTARQAAHLRPPCNGRCRLLPPSGSRGGLRDRFDAALVTLGRLDQAMTLMPEPPLFLYSYASNPPALSAS